MILATLLALGLAPLLPAGAEADSGRIVGIAESPSERLNPPRLMAPGEPPTLRFRYFDAADRGRFGNLGLMTDDAGH